MAPHVGDRFQPVLREQLEERVQRTRGMAYRPDRRRALTPGRSALLRLDQTSRIFERSNGARRIPHQSTRNHDESESIGNQAGCFIFFLCYGRH
jgi:hypothetical protein